MNSRPPAPPPLSLYVHIPWCLKKCPYCDFNSHAFDGDLPERQYVDRLLEDLDRDLDYVQGREILSVFIGGGTPSLFSPQAIERLLSGLQKRLAFTGDAEITMEANPGTFETDKFRAFRAAGINRLSIGIQSFRQEFLTALGRVHDDREARLAAENARTAGFDNFNLDLMFGLPGQTVARGLEDLAFAQSLNPPHLSWYQLTIEPNTVFYRRPPALPEDDSIGEMQEQGMDLLMESGLARYEVSAYARPAKRSRHNLNYWQFGDYLGIGAGAHGKLTVGAEGRILRTRKVRQPGGYLGQDNFTAESREVSAGDLPLEFMMNALRLVEGCDEKLFEERTGLPIAGIADRLQTLRNAGLLKEDRLAATEKGLMFLNDVLAEFLQEESGRQETMANLIKTLPV